jgi:hypothetical protein
MSLLGAWCNGDRFRQIGCRVRESRAGWHVTAHERQRSENLLRENGAEIIHGTGSFIDCHTVEVRGFIWPGASPFVASQFFLELSFVSNQLGANAINVLAMGFDGLCAQMKFFCDLGGTLTAAD